MGEIAEMMLDGTLCEQCGSYMGDGGGFVRHCFSCAKDFRALNAGGNDAPRSKPATPKVFCPTCKKRVKAVGLQDHMRDAHGASKHQPGSKK